KVIWPRNVPPWEARFAYDSVGYFISDKGYLLAGIEAEMCSYLNSPIVLWILDRLTTKLRGGYLELKSDTVVGRIPVPDHIQSPINQSPADLHTASVQDLGLSIVEASLIWHWYQDRQVYRSQAMHDLDAQE